MKLKHLTSILLFLITTLILSNYALANSKAALIHPKLSHSVIQDHMAFCEQLGEKDVSDFNPEFKVSKGTIDALVCKTTGKRSQLAQNLPSIIPMGKRGPRNIHPLSSQKINALVKSKKKIIYPGTKQGHPSPNWSLNIYVPSGTVDALT